MGLSYFWFIAAAVVGAMDLYFGNFFLLVISAAAFTTALFSFFLSSVYLQVAIFTVISLLVISYLMLLQRHLREVDFYSEILRRHIGKTVTVHEWRHNRYSSCREIQNMENAFEPASSDSVEGKIPEGVRLPNLDDPLVIKDLLRAHAMAVSKRLAEAVHKNVRREEVVQADQRAAAFLATTLLGQNPAYAKAAVNTPERIEKLLRAEFTEALKGFGIKEEEAADPAVFMQLVMFLFTNQVHELINELQKNPDEIEAKGSQALDALLESWVKKLTKEKCDA